MSRSFLDGKLRRCHLLPDYINTIPNLSAGYTRPRALPSSGSCTAPIGRRDNIKFRSEAPCCVHGPLLCSLPHWLSGQGAAAVRTHWKFISVCISVASCLPFATWRKDDSRSHSLRDVNSSWSETSNAVKRRCYKYWQRTAIQRLVVNGVSSCFLKYIMVYKRSEEWLYIRRTMTFKRHLTCILNFL